MILPYHLRLVCLCLASFFLVHLALGLVIWLIAPAAIRMAERIRPRWAARFLLILRLFPPGVAVLAVAGLCVPSYLWLEPEATTERVSLECLTAALAGLAIWGISITRGIRATARSFGYIRDYQRVGRKTRLSGERSPILVIHGSAPFLALAGIVHSRIVVSRGLVHALSAEQLAAALRHERAHGISHDNLKRLVILLAPDILPFFRGLERIERGWARLTEWAADDRAVAGDSRRALSLAAALVRVARLGAASQPSPLVTTLLPNSQDLPARVDRLLRPTQAAEKPERGLPVLLASATLMLAGSMVAAMLQPPTLHSVHRLLELLIQ